MLPVFVAFTPLLAPALLIGLGVLALLTLAFGVYARRPSTLLRALGLALILLALAGPALVREDRAGLRDVVAILVDRSGSQTIGERPAQTQAALDGLKERLERLGNVDVRVIEGGRSDGTDEGTRLFKALADGLADVPAERVGAVFAITDGVVEDVPVTAAAYGLHAPFHGLVTGQPGERDRRVELLDAPRFGIVGKDQTITLRVDDTAGGREPVVLQVRRDGQPVATLRAAPGAKLQVPVRIEHGGPNVVELEVETLPGELTALNNKAVLTIEGVRDKLKVLLVSGEPNPGERMWRNLLKADANVDLVHFTILRPPEKQDGTPINELSLIAFPTADLFGRKINDFDLIVFDRYSNQSILPAVYFDNIVRYVRDGGALLMAAGPDFAEPEGLYYSPLGRIAPARPDGTVSEEPFRAAVTAEGEKHPVTRGLPGAAATPPAWSLWFRQVNATVQRGAPLLSGIGGKPLLVLSREGKGRVGLLLTDQMWLWARGFEGGGPYLDLLRRLAHWLMKEPELEEEALRAHVEGHDLVVERQSLKGETPPLQITTPTGATVTATLTAAAPGLARTKVPIDDLGLYRVSDGTLSALAVAGPENPREFQDVVSTTARLQPLAAATGGTVRRLASDASGAITLPRLVAMRDSPIYGGADYAAIRRTDASEVRGVAMTPLAIGGVGLLALIGSVLVAWLAEGRRGRVSV